MTSVVPAIIPDDFRLMKTEMGQMKDFVRRVQIDIIDGQYAPEATWPYNQTPDGGAFEEIINGREGFPFWEDVQFEIDLMATNPETILDDWIATGASTVIIHASSTEKLPFCIDKLLSKGVGVAIALLPSDDPEPVIKEVNDFLAQEFEGEEKPPTVEDIVEFIQIMGNDRIGYHGVELDRTVYTKIRQLRKQFPDLDIGVDIGVNFETAPRLVEAGATRLVSG